jgi:glycosyltransferase involved in cell wall biosynthesis
MADKPLTVVQLLPALEAGGVERGTLEIAHGLVKAGHRSIVVSAGGLQVSRLTGQGSEHVQWPIGRKALWTLRWVRRLRALLRDNRADIVHARSRLPAWLAYLAWKGMPADSRPHFITTVHGLYSVNRYSRIMSRGEAVIAVSQATRDYVLNNYPDTDPARVHLIERGIDPAVFRFAYRPGDSWLSRWYQEMPFLLERQVLTLPGRMTRRKGHEDFLRLLARLKDSELPWYGLIVGGEDPAHAGYMRELQGMVRKLGLEGLVTFTGHRLDVRDIMAVSNLVFSLSTKPESFGRTVTEALSLGVPVIGYDHGGVGESLNRAYPEGRVPPGDIAALERTTLRLLQQPVAVEPCRFATVEQMVEQTLALYQGLVRG